LLLGFCNAMQHGYVAVTYIKMLDPNSKPSIFLVGTKSKVVPIKTLTIPRLELKAALLLARWMDQIRTTLGTHLNIVEFYAWSDSATVLPYLTNSHNAFKICISNREIWCTPDCFNISKLSMVSYQVLGKSSWLRFAWRLSVRAAQSVIILARAPIHSWLSSNLAQY